jgi:flavin-dependent dehydrogenase
MSAIGFAEIPELGDASIGAEAHRHSMDCFDVVVVGARCAGAVTAMLLARAGLRVLVVDRQQCGAETISGLMIKPDGVARLLSWGILGDVLATNCPPITAAEVVIAGTTIAAPLTAESFALAPRRTKLDPILQEHARRAGAEIRFATSFQDWEDGIVVIDRQFVRTRLLIGADGRGSRVARAVGSSFSVHRPGRSGAWYGFWDNCPLEGLRAELGNGIFAGAFPTNDHQVIAFVQIPVAQWRAEQRGRDYLTGLQRAARVNAAVGGSRLASGVVGVRDLPSYIRRSGGAGWALVGDAAHHKDPLGARGIGDAFLGAELLTHHVLSGWDSDLDVALTEYDRDIRSTFAQSLELNDRLAQLNRPADEIRSTWSRLARWTYRDPRTTAS